MEAIYNITRYVLPFLKCVLALTLVLTLSTCSEDPTSPEGSGGNGEVNPGGNLTLHEDEGYVGLIINTRPIFKKRYFPVTASISFPNHSQFDTTIVIDPSTNLAILSIHRTELTEQDSTDFAQGMPVNIIITDSSQQQLAMYSSNQYVMDDSNNPLNLSTNLPFIKPSLYFNESLAYLLQPENVFGVLTSTNATEYSAGFFGGDSIKQQFYLTKIEGNTPNTFLIKHLGYASGEYWYYEAGQSQDYINLRDGDPDEFVLEPDEDGWLKIRHKTTGKFLVLDTLNTVHRLRLSITGLRFRIISDVNWNIEDIGTFYNQPIMGRANASFAYSETLENCSRGTLVTKVGSSEIRSTTLTYTIKESLQLFSSESITAGFTVRGETKAKIGNDKIASEEQTYSVEISGELNVQTSETYTTENTWSKVEQRITEVSRDRTYTVPPYTLVEIFDEVKSIDNVTLPFTQVLRIRAQDRRNNYDDLSGPQIVELLLSNLMESAIKKVGDDFVDITLRGNVKMDRIMHAFTSVLEDTTACY